MKKYLFFVFSFHMFSWSAAVQAQSSQKNSKSTPQKKKEKDFRVLKYDFLFKGKKSGFVSQRERFLPNGDILIEGKSSSLFRILFFKIDTKVSFRSLFRKGQLIEFSLHQIQRGKHLKITAKRINKGFHVVHVSHGKKRVRVFPLASFAATSREYRAPLRPKGTRLKRNILNFIKLKVIPQVLVYQKKQRRVVAGKERVLFSVSGKGARGTALLFFDMKGTLIETLAKIPMVGKIEIRLRKVLGRAL